MKTKFKLQDNAKSPVRSSGGAAGFDIHAISYAELWPGVHAILSTGVAVAIPEGHVGLIWPRSGMAAKFGVDTLAGVIDCDYRGEIKVSLINHGDKMIEIKPGDRIAQIIVQPFAADAEVVTELDDTSRGAAGFGSTGV